MIYSIEIKFFPAEDAFISCTEYMDANGEPWKIAIVKSGFVIGYFGDPYFKDTHHHVMLNGEEIVIKNTGCFFVNDSCFDVFYEFRDLFLGDFFTDSIWEIIAELISERLSIQPLLVECEVNNH